MVALPRHPSSAPPLDTTGNQRLLACLAVQSDTTLAEISLALLAVGGPLLSRTAMWRATERLGWGHVRRRLGPSW